jgi:hypothetical protein
MAMLSDKRKGPGRSPGPSLYQRAHLHGGEESTLCLLFDTNPTPSHSARSAGARIFFAGLRRCDLPSASNPANYPAAEACFGKSSRLARDDNSERKRQMSERFELIGEEGDISGHLRLTYGSGTNDSMPFVITLTRQYVARALGRAAPISFNAIEKYAYDNAGDLKAMALLEKGSGRLNLILE